MALQVWQDALSADSQAHLVQVLPGVLERARRGTAASAELEACAHQLDHAALELQAYKGELVTSPTMDK
jgi:hypothetical protein